MAKLGFIGAGTITDAVVQGLHAAGNTKHDIHLSPRSEARSRALAARYERVIREDSNEAVVAESDIVFLAVRPQQMPELVGLRFRAEQTVVSFLAGTPIDQLLPFVAPAARLVRVVPLPCIGLGQGPILMMPSDPTVEALFGKLGDLIVLTDEANFASVSAITGLMSSHFELQNVALDWLKTQSVPEGQAALYIRSLFAGLGAIGLAADRAGRSIDVAEYETRGRLNEAGRAHLGSRCGGRKPFRRAAPGGSDCTRAEPQCAARHHGRTDSGARGRGDAKGPSAHPPARRG
jgi:pyrroline-5-carboxylate reductase